MTTLKDIENELNSKKAEFVQKIVRDTVTHTTMIAEKTKDTNYAGQIAKAAQDLVAQDMNIPDLHIKDGTTSTAEPQIKITYPNLMNRIFYQGAPIQMIFETKNVKFPYSCYVFANAAGNKIDLYVDQNIRFDKHTIPNILVNKINKELPSGKYDIFIVLYDNNTGQRKQLRDSKGQPVVDKAVGPMGIEIKPVKTTTGGVHMKIITPSEPLKVVPGVDVDFEVHTDIKPPFTFSIFYQKEGPIYDKTIKSPPFSGVIKGKFKIPKAYNLIKELKFLIYAHPHNKPEDVIAEAKIKVVY